MYLYVIRIGPVTEERAMYKIGVSNTTRVRETLQPNYRERLYTVVEIPSLVPREWERSVHLKLKSYRVGDDWFSLAIWEICDIIGLAHGTHASL